MDSIISAIPPRIIKYFRYLLETHNKKQEKNKVLISLSLAALTILYSIRTLNNKKSLVSYADKSNKIIPIPTQSMYPYVGHMFSLGKLPAHKIAQWHNKMGPIIQLKMGIHTWISISDHKLAHKVFVSNGAKTSYRPHSTYAYFHYSNNGKGIGFAQPDSGWREARSAVISVLAPKNIQTYMKTIHKQSMDLALGLIEATKAEGQADSHNYLELYALNVILSISFSKHFNSIHDPEFIMLSKMIKTSMKLAGIDNDLSNFLPALSIFDYFSGIQSTMKKFTTEERDPIFTKLIEDAEESDQPNILHHLKLNGFNLTLEEKIILMFDLIGGGTDTISTTLYWNFAIMCVYPEIQRTAATEIDQFIESNGRIPTFNERHQLPYCVSVIKECMRFKPTTSFGLPHSVYEDVEVDGYIIPKGATLLTNMVSLHMDPKIYQAPEKFEPNRFANNLKTMQAAANGKFEERDHFNFGWGRRICPAIYLAEVEVFSAFVSVLSQCVIEPVNQEQLPKLDEIQNIGVNILPFSYKVKFTKRADSLV